jgi:hypothetical protein
VGLQGGLVEFARVERVSYVFGPVQQAFVLTEPGPPLRAERERWVQKRGFSPLARGGRSG